MRWRVRPTGSPSESPSVVTSASPTRSVEQRYRYPPIWLKDTLSARRFNSFVVSALPLAPRRSFTANLKSPGTWIFWATAAARPSSRWPSASFDSSLDSFGSWAHEPHTHHSPFPIPLSPSRDRKSTRLNSSHGYISYAVFCLKKKKKRIFTASFRWILVSLVVLVIYIFIVY